MESKKKPAPGSIEEIIAEAQRASDQAGGDTRSAAPVEPPAPVPASPRPEPRPVANFPGKAEGGKGGSSDAGPARREVQGAPKPVDPFRPKPADAPKRAAASIEPIRPAAVEPLRAVGGESPRPVPRPEIVARPMFTQRQATAESLNYVDETLVSPAMSAVREVELEEDPAEAGFAEVDEPVEVPETDAQGAIDRAIATLDREARGEAGEPLPELPAPAPMPPRQRAPQPSPVEPAEPVPAKRNGFDAAALKKQAFAAVSRSEPVVEEPVVEDEPFIKRREAPPVARREAAPPSRGNPFAALRGGEQPFTAKREAPPKRRKGEAALALDAGFQRAAVEAERSGGNPLTIFLVVFVVLLLGAGGAGFWAWREGYIDLDSMFASTSVAEAETPAAAAGGPSSVAEVVASAEPRSLPPAPGNTAPAPQQLAAIAEPTANDRLAPGGLEPSGDGAKSEERLGFAEPAAPAAQQAALPSGTPDAAVTLGSQSLLLEASDDGRTGAVPFSGTVDWTRGTDETGGPTLVGKAKIPARNLEVDMLIRRNADPALPASHLMEINFSVPDTFVGGAIAGLPGVLLKNEELVQGTPLVGASARIVGNSFLFALSDADADRTTNTNLLTSRKWIDLALVYATGKRAIITLEKDDEAEQLFAEVVTAWNNTDTAAAN